MVDDGIVAGIVGAPFVNVVGRTAVGPQLQGADAQDAGATATVQHAAALEVHAHQHAANHARGLVGPGTEGHVGVNLNHDG